MRVNITTEYITLGALLKFAGIAASGAHAKELVAEGLCRVNGEVVRERGRKLRPGDRVEVMGEMIELAAED